MGQFGNKNGEYSRIKSLGGTSRGDVDEIRLSRAYKLIVHIANSLNLSSFIVDV